MIKDRLPDALDFRQKRFYTSSGSRIHVDYKAVVGQKGDVELVPAGETDIYDQIQSHREACDIKCIVQRYLNGDAAALDRRIPLFMDASLYPTTLAGWQQAQMDAEAYFAMLPVEVRREFNHDPKQFFAAAGDPDFVDRVGNQYFFKEEESGAAPAKEPALDLKESDL